MIQSACCLFIVKHLWVVQIWSLLLLSLMLRLISSRGKFHVLILFVHEIVVKCLRHTGWKVLLMFFIFQIIRGWGRSERGNVATVVFYITIHEVTPSATCPTVCSSRLFKFLIKWWCVNNMRTICRVMMWRTTTDNWGVIEIPVRINFLLGGRGCFVEIGLFPKICAMCLWHQRILFKLRGSISNLDWLSVMSIR